MYGYFIIVQYDSHFSFSTFLTASPCSRFFEVFFSKVQSAWHELASIGVLFSVYQFRYDVRWWDLFEDESFGDVRRMRLWKYSSGMHCLLAEMM